MKQSPSWEANRFAASQGIPRISRNPKVHYRTHKRPPPVSILGQLNPVHRHTSHLLEETAPTPLKIPLSGGPGNREATARKQAKAPQNVLGSWNKTHIGFCMRIMTERVYPAVYRSVSQPPGRGPLPGPGINYTGPREVLLEFVILVF